MQRVQHNRRHGWLDAVKNPGNDGLFTIRHVHPAEPNQQHQRRQYKQCTRHYTAPSTVHQPAQVGGQLLRLRARQQHAKVQRMQKAFFRYPAALFNQLAVHDGNLPRRAAKADEAELQPKAQRFFERDLRRLV